MSNEVNQAIDRVIDALGELEFSICTLENEDDISALRREMWSNFPREDV